MHGAQRTGPEVIVEQISHISHSWAHKHANKARFDLRERPGNLLVDSFFVFSWLISDEP